MFVGFKGRNRTKRKKKIRMKVSKFRLAVSIAILAIGLLTVYFLVQDIHRLQEQYESNLPSKYPIGTESWWEMIKQRLDEIQNAINLRKTAVVSVVAATAVTLLVLNRRKLKQKCVATALILLIVTFFQTPIVQTFTRSQACFERYYDRVKLPIPQDCDLESVTGYTTPRPNDVAEGFIDGYIEVVSHIPYWNDWMQV